MTYTKTIVCLANSRKPAGRLIAGREVTPTGFGAWIRPVSERPTLEISEYERNGRDGRDPALLDVVEIPMKTSQPQHYQTENHLIDSSTFWKKVDRVAWADIQPAVEEPPLLWTNGSSSLQGENDRIPEAAAYEHTRSLYLLRPEGLIVIVASEERDVAPSRRRVRARFELTGHRYRLSVTDPVFESWALRQPNGEYSLPNAVICVNLAEVFHGFAYKVIVGVITQDQGSVS
jgi:hypothetical protein